VHQFPQRLADQLAGRTGPEEFHPGGIDKNDFFVAVDKKGIGRNFDQAPVTLLAGLERLLGSTT